MGKLLSPAIEEALEAALNPESLPAFRWVVGDDKCDCTYQRIGFWTNPHLAETREVRLCCLYKKFEEQWPECFRSTRAYWDDNRAAWALHPREWDSEEATMPVYLWYRQLARQQGKPLAQIREEYKDRISERPKARPWYLGKKYNSPTLAERIKAFRAKMVAAGWIVGDESHKPLSGHLEE